MTIIPLWAMDNNAFFRFQKIKPSDLPHSGHCQPSAMCRSVMMRLKKYTVRLVKRGEQHDDQGAEFQRLCDELLGELERWVGDDRLIWKLETI